jgi:hypothetical protein
MVQPTARTESTATQLIPPATAATLTAAATDNATNRLTH